MRDAALSLDKADGADADPPPPAPAARPARRSIAEAWVAAEPFEASLADGGVLASGGVPAAPVDVVSAAQAGNLTAEPGERNSSTALRKRSKVVLVLLETTILPAMLGLDRLYMGAVTTAIAKCTVCVCSCGAGGLLWWFVDWIMVFLNCVALKPQLDSLGMASEFTEESLRPARALALAFVVLQALCCVCGGYPLPLAWRWVFGEKAASSSPEPSPRGRA